MTFYDATNSFPAKWHLRNEPGNSILMTRHYPDLGSASNWLCCSWNLLQPISSTTQIWVVTLHQYGISPLVSQTSFHEENSDGIAQCCLFSQAMHLVMLQVRPKLNSGWNFLTLVDSLFLCLPALIIHELGLGNKIYWESTYNRPQSCWLVWEQKNPHHSPLPFIQLFSIGSSNSGTMLHGGMGEEKLYFPLWKSVKHQKTPLWWSIN